MLRIRLLVELDDADIEYTREETKKMAHNLSIFMQNRSSISFDEIDGGSNWFVGFIELPECCEKTYKKTIKKLYLEWLEDKGGHATHYSIEDMDKEGHLCCPAWNSCVCEGCKFAYDGKDPCRIGCTEA